MDVLLRIVASPLVLSAVNRAQVRQLTEPAASETGQPVDRALGHIFEHADSSPLFWKVLLVGAYAASLGIVLLDMINTPNAGRNPLIMLACLLARSGLSALPIRRTECRRKEIYQRTDARNNISLRQEDGMDRRIIGRLYMFEKLDQPTFADCRSCKMLCNAHHANACKTHCEKRHPLVTPKPASGMKGHALAVLNEAPAVQMLAAAIPSDEGHAGEAIDCARHTVAVDEIGGRDNHPAQPAKLSVHQARIRQPPHAHRNIYPICNKIFVVVGEAQIKQQVRMAAKKLWDKWRYTVEAKCDGRRDAQLPLDLRFLPLPKLFRFFQRADDLPRRL